MHAETPAPTSKKRGRLWGRAAFVLAILAFLILAALPNFLAQHRRTEKARESVRALADAERRYYAEHGRYLAIAPEPAPQGPAFEALGIQAQLEGWAAIEVQVEGDEARVILTGQLGDEGRTMMEIRLKAGDAGPLEERYQPLGE